MKSILSAAILLVAATAIVGCDGKAQPAASAKVAEPAAATTSDWCAEHGVPESVCTRCNSKLIAEFKKKGDWCKEHNLPESQCTECHPELKAKFAAMAPKKGGK